MTDYGICPVCGKKLNEYDGYLRDECANNRIAMSDYNDVYGRISDIEVALDELRLQVTEIQNAIAKIVAALPDSGTNP